MLPSIHVYTSNMTYHFTFRPFFLVLNFVDFDKKPSLLRKSVFTVITVVKRLRILYVVERILYDAHLCAESAIIFPRSSLRQALPADGTRTRMLF